MINFIKWYWREELDEFGRIIIRLFFILSLIFVPLLFFAFNLMFLGFLSLLIPVGLLVYKIGYYVYSRWKKFVFYKDSAISSLGSDRP